MMLRLQEIGCHNINLVTPTHYSAHILRALDIAAEKGLRLPIVYNTSGWERLEVLEVLNGVVDIYLPDFKYWDRAKAAKYSSGAESYPEVTKAAILEMHRQVGVAKPAQNGIMRSGLMIRHLVMPNNVGGSEKIMKWIAENLPKDTYVNIMAQYNPLNKAYDYPEISRRITGEEYERVVKRAQQLGLTNLDIQGYRWFRRF
jgi:putative pyruvate formate lyase activating enzyme